MRLGEKLSSLRTSRAVLIGGATLLALLATYLLAVWGVESLVVFLQMALLVVITIAILRAPFIGIVISIASLPVLELIPSIPFGTSAVSAVGGLTLASYLGQALFRHKKNSQAILKGLLWGVAFVIWIFLSSPEAAIFPDEDGRAWLFTFVQLLVLAWLASQLLDSPKKHRVLMWVYSIAAVISAFYGIQQGFIGETVAESIRTAGLADGANAAARYFIVAVVFLYSLQGETRRRFLRLLIWLGIGILIFGMLNTVSRTGLLLLVSGIGLLVIQRFGDRRRIQAVLLLFAVLVIVWFFADNIVAIAGSILPAIRAGSDTVGVRYELWRSAFAMWLDHPVSGVGIGQYTYWLPYYSRNLLASRYLVLGAHNMYLQVLAETGIIGLFLFLAFLGRALNRLWRGSRDQGGNFVLAQTWLIVFLIMLVGGLTKSDHYDKLIWLTAGIGLSAFWKTAPSAKQPALSNSKGMFHRRLIHGNSSAQN